MSPVHTDLKPLTQVKRANAPRAFKPVGHAVRGDDAIAFEAVHRSGIGMGFEFGDQLRDTGHSV